MDIESFIELVGRMRENQKAYFKTRSPYYMEQSKKLEKQVDIELERLSGNLFMFFDGTVQTEDFPAGFYLITPDGKKYYTRRFRYKDMEVFVKANGTKEDDR